VERLTGLLYLFADTTKFDSADHLEISGDTQRASKVYQSLRLPVGLVHSIHVLGQISDSGRGFPNLGG
jgi:hypothetical protein